MKEAMAKVIDTLIQEDFQGALPKVTLYFALNFVCMHIAYAFTRVVTKISSDSFGTYFLDVSWKVSNFSLTVTLYWLFILQLSNEHQ